MEFQPILESFPTLVPTWQFLCNQILLQNPVFRNLLRRLVLTLDLAQVRLSILTGSAKINKQLFGKLPLFTEDSHNS